MRSEEEYREAVQLIEAGINDCEIGRRLAIPRGTIRDWRIGRQAGSGGRTIFWSGHQRSTCFRCEGGCVDEEAYAYLLGVYLGDGCLSLMPRKVYSLRISCDLRYPHIIDEIATCIVIVRGSETVGFASRTGCVDVNTSWKHWPCLFPQHGPGRKHERAIELAPWQEAIVAAQPNRHINEVTRKLPTGLRRYQYPRYVFTNASADILGIFTDTLGLLGVHWTKPTARDISVARRADVSYLDSFVGPKK